MWEGCHDAGLLSWAVVRVLLNVRPTLPWGGGGWVGLAEFQGGWVSNHPPAPPG